MTEIPEHLLNRAREARSGLAASASTGAGRHSDDLFGTESANEREAHRKEQFEASIAAVGSVLVSAHTFLDSADPSVNARALIVSGDHTSFGIHVERGKKKYLRASVAREAHVSIGNLGVKLEAYTIRQIPIERTELDEVIGGGLFHRVKVAKNLAKEGRVDVTGNFFGDTELVKRVFNKPGVVKRESIAGIIYEGEPEQYDETQGHRYGIALCSTEGGAWNTKPLMASARLPDNSNASSGFNTNSGMSDEFWSGHVYVGVPGFYGSRRSDPRHDLVSLAAEALQGVINTIGAQVQSPQNSTDPTSLEENLRDIAVHQITPLVNRY